MADDPRFTQEDIDTWHRDGAVFLPGFFSPEEIAGPFKDMETLYGDRANTDLEAKTADKSKNIGQVSFDQFQNLADMPFPCSPALNLLGLHPQLIALAKAALGAPNVHMYQSHNWAKFTGGADYEQPFHCDYKNHTLTVPSDETRNRTINFMIYITDVTIESGAIAYVPQPASDAVTGKDRSWFLDGNLEAQEQLVALQKRAPGPAGSVFAYGIDVYHRGMNLLEPGAKRYTLTSSYKAAGNDMIGWSAWPIHFMKPWGLIMDNASPEQLACIGIPRPGDAFWTDRTLRRTQERWPNMDLSAYREALQPV